MTAVGAALDVGANRCFDGPLGSHIQQTPIPCYLPQASEKAGTALVTAQGVTPE